MKPTKRTDVTPSEDGREVPEVVAWLDERGAHVPPHCASFQDDLKKFERAMASNGAEPLMTVAQHSRIVAALKAEITQLKTDLPGDTVADRLDRLADRQVGEVITEHNGCGRGAQVDQLTVRLYPGDKVVMLRGPLGLAMTRRDEK